MARLIAAPVRRAVALLGLCGLILSGLLQGAERPFSEPANLSPPAVAANRVALVAPPQLLEITTDFPGPDTAYLTLGTLMSAGKGPLAAPVVPGIGLPSLGGGKAEDSWRHRLARRMQRMGQQMVAPQRVAGALRQLQSAPDAVPGAIGERMQREAVRAVLDTGIDELKRLEGTHLRNLELRYRTPLGDQKALLEMETLISLLDTQEGLLFGQAGLLWQDGDEAVNVGGGYRHTAADGALLLGVNAFYDYLSDPGLQRYSLGLEAKGRVADLYANWYRALGDGKNVGSDYVYTPDGWDIQLAGRLPLLPWVEFSGKYYHWNRLRGQEDREGMRYALKLQPVPLVSLEAQYDSPEGSQDDDWGVEASLKYRFGVPLSEQMEVARVKAHGPVHRRFEQVRREYAQRVERVQRASAAASLELVRDSLQVNNVLVAAGEVRVVQEIRTAAPYEIEMTLRRTAGTAAAATFAGRFGGTARLGTASPADVDVQPVQTGRPGGSMASGLIANPRDFALSFAAGQAELLVIISVTVIQDSEIEGAEDLRLEVAGESLVVPLLEIREEIPRVRFAQAGAEAAEGAGPVTVAVTVSPVPLAALSIPVQVVMAGTTASDPSDYSLSGLAGGVLSLAQGQPSASLTVTLVNNTIPDGARILQLELQSGTGYALGSPAAYSLTITDDEGPAAGTPAVRFAAQSSTVAEGRQARVQLQAAPAPTTPLTLRLRLSGAAQPGTGPGDDYDPASASPALTDAGAGVYTVTMRSASLMLTLPITDDARDESDEPLLLTVLPATGYVPGAPPQHRVVIEDNDELIVRFTSRSPDTSVSEAAAMAARTLTITVAPTLAPAAPLAVSLRLEGTAGEGAGQDYTLTGVTGTGQSRTLTLPQSTTAAAAITLQIQDDSVIDGAEGIVLRLLPGDGYTLDPAASIYRVQIEDDERAVQFSAATASVAEGRRTAVSLVSQGPSSGLLLVQVGIGGGARAGASCDDGTADYVLAGDNLVAVPDPAAATMRSVGISGTGAASLRLEACTDTATEGSETVELTIQPSASYLAGTPSVYRLTITDSAVATVPVVTFASSRGSATEAGTTVRISLSAAPAPVASLTIPYRVAALGTTAVAGTDYTALPANAAVTFPAGQTSAQLSLQLLDDNLNDGVKTLLLELPASTDTSLYIVGAANQHTLEIADDEAPARSSAVSFAATNSRIAEGGGPLSIALNIVPAAQAPFTVRYSTTGTVLGSGLTATSAAVAGTDYTTPAGTLAVSVGTNTVNIQLALIDNSVVQTTDRGLVLQLQADSSAGYTLGAQSRHEVIIEDDDETRLGFAATGASLREDAAGAHPITVSLSPTSASALRVPLTASGTADLTTDYTLAAMSPAMLTGTHPNYQLEIPGNAGTAVLQVTQVQNTDREGVEEAIFTLGVSSGYALTSQTTYTLQITDDDLPANALTVAFTAADSSALEGAGTVMIGVQASRAVSAGGLTVAYSVAGSATSGADFTALPGTLTIAGGGTTASISLTIVDDTANEADEEVLLALESSPTSEYFLGASQRYALTIQDNDALMVGFSTPLARTVMENVGTIQVPITASGAPNRELQLRYSLQPGNGLSGGDYVAPSGVATLASGGLQASISIRVTDDIVDEDAETLTLTLETPAPGSGYTLDSAATTYVLTISDNDVPEVSFVTANSTVAEDGSTPLQVGVSVPIPSRTELRIPVTVGGTATDTADYSLAGLTASGELVIPMGVGSATLTVTPIDDRLTEGGERVVLTLGSGGTGEYTVARDGGMHTVTITDDEQASGAILANFSGAASAATEGGATATFTVDVTRLTTGMLPVRLRVSSGGGVTSGDYSLVADGAAVTPGSDGRFTLTFTGSAAEPDSLTLAVTATDDAVDELDESLVFSLERDTSSTPDYLLGTILTHTVTLTDNDVPAVSFAVDASSDRMGTASEDGGSVDLTVDVLPVPAQTLTVGVMGSGTATATDDYTLGALTVPVGSATGTLRVTLVDNTVDEASETLTLTLQGDTTYAVATTPSGAGTYTLTITDDDTPLLSFNTARSTVAENGGGAATLTVTATPAPRGALTAQVGLNAIGGAAEPGDYTLAGLTGTGTTRMLAIPARIADSDASTSATFTLTPVDDTTPEGTEGVSFTLQAGTGYDIGAPATQDVLIDDNESASTGRVVSFNTGASPPVSEGAAVTVTVDVTGLGDGESLDVMLRPTNTSVATTDYSLAPMPAASGIVTLSVTGSSSTTDSATLTVTAQDDTLDELDETLALNLVASVGNYVFGATFRHTVTIQDTDVPEVSFAGSRTSTASEDSGSVDLTVDVDPVPAQTLTVGVMDSGTATVSDDYTLGTLTVPVGSATGTLRVTLVDNTVDEASETLTLTLQGDTTYAVATTPSGADTYTLTINDDDTPQLSFTATASNARESSTPATTTITVRAEPAPRAALTVPVTISGTAMETDDYTLAGLVAGTPRTLAIPARNMVADASTSATFTLTPVNDNNIENVETVQLTLGGATDSGAAGDYELNALAASHSVEIADDDAAATGVQASFAAISSTATERGTAATVTVNVTGLADGATLDVMLRVTEGAGVASGDYTLNPAATTGTVTLAFTGTTANTISLDLTVTAADDVTGDELDETLTLALIDVPGSYAVGANRMHTVTIRDVAQPQVSFAQAASSVSEDAGFATLVVNVSPAPGAALPVGVTATVGATGHTAPAMLTLGMGASSGNYLVTLMDNNNDDPAQMLTFTLDTGTGYTVDNTAMSHTLTVTDDDTPTVSLGAPSSAALDENDATMVSTITVSVAPPPHTAATALMIPVQLGGTATAVSDYTLSASGTGVTLGTQTPPLLAVMPGTSSATLTLTPVDDTLPEGLETIQLTLLATGTSGGAGDYALGADASRQVNLRDDEAAAVGVQASFATATSTATERGTAATVTVNVTGLADGATLNVMLDVTRGTGATTGDYTLNPAATTDTVTLTFTGTVAATDTASLTVTAEDDGTGDELDETLTLALAAGTGYTLAGQVQHVVTIRDAAEPTVSFAETTSSADEGDGSVDLAVSAMPAPAEDLTIPVMVMGAPASYTVPGMVAIARGTTAGVLTVQLAADDMAQNPDVSLTLTLQADTITGAAGDYALGTDSTHTLTVAEDDTRGVTVTPTMVAVLEGATGTYTVVLDTVPSGDVTITPTSGDTMTATVAPTAGLTFTTVNWNTPQTVTVTGVTDTDMSESATTVTHAVSGADYASEMADPVAVTVAEVAGTDPTAMFTAASSTTAEAGTAATVTVRLSAAPATSTTLTMLLEVTRGTTATHGSTADYTLAAGGTALTPDATTNQFNLELMGDGTETDVPLTITALTDTEIEGDETVELTLLAGTGYRRVAPLVHTVTITDATVVPVVSFADATGSASEADGSATITVNSDVMPAATLTLGVSAQGGSTATQGVDYSLGTLTIADTGTTGTLTVTLTDDMAIEGDETLTLTLQADTDSPARYTVSGTAMQHVLTITDNDMPVVGFTESASVVEEPATGTTDRMVMVAVTPTRAAGDPMLDIPVTVGTGSTATQGSGSDYTLTGLTTTMLRIPAGASSATLTVSVRADSEVESTETVVLQLGPVTGYTVMPNEHILRINDRAVPSIAFEPATALSLTEMDPGDAAVTATLTLVATGTPAPTTGAPVQVALSLAGSATHGGSADYTLGIGTGLTGGLPVTTDAVSGTTGATLTMTAAQADFILTVIADNANEPTETVALTVESGTLYRAGATASREITITDDDLPTVSFAAPRTSMAIEGAVAMLTVDISQAPTAASGLPVNVMAVTAGSTATAGDDYTLGTLRFAMGATTAVLNVDIGDDGLHEGDEILTLELQDDTDSPARYTVASAAAERRYELTIPANDEPVVRFAIASDSAAEADGDVSVVVQADPVPRTGVTLTVPVTVDADLSTATDPADYTLAGLSSGNLEITAGSATATFRVSLVDDTDVEIAETVVLNLGTGTGFSLGTQRQYTLTVTSEDVRSREVTIAAASASVAEDGGAVAITVSVDRAPTDSGGLTVNLSVGGTALSGDYTLTDAGGTAITPAAGAFMQTIPMSMSSLSFTMTPMDDTMNEMDEQVRFEVLAGTGYVQGSPAVAAVTITDNDEPTVSFAEDVTSDRMAEVIEGATAMLTVNISPAPASGLSVGVMAVTGSTATAGDDYSLGTLRFAANATSAVLSVTVANDTLHEAAETLTLELQDGTEYGVAADPAHRYELTIPENDLPVVSFTQSAARAAETDGDVEVVVQADPVPRAGVTLTVPVTVDTDLSTATDPADYTLAGLSSGNLEITAGSATATFTVALVDDSDVENQESVVLDLGTGSDYSLGTPLRYTLTVDSDDQPDREVTIAAASASVAEDGGAVAITVSVDRAPTDSGGLTVNLRVSGASSGDYTLADAASTAITPTSGAFMQTIPMSMSSLSFTMTPIDDTMNEMDEQVRFEVLAGTGYLPGSPAVATVTITDDDEPTVSFATDDSGDRMGTVSEDVGSVDLTVSISPTPASVLPVTVMAVTGSTAEAADYSLGTLRFAANAATAMLRVTVRDDGAHEPAETLTLELRDGTGYAAAADPEHRYVLTITDNDEPMVNFAIPSTNAAEAAGDVMVVVRANPAPRPGVTLTVPVMVETDLSTATDPDDYTLSGLSSGGNLEITAGSATATFAVSLVDDNDVEGTETVVLELGMGTGYGLVTPMRYTLTVSSEDVLPTISFSSARQTAAENAGNAAVTVLASPAPPGNLTVTLRVSGSGVRGATGDYTLPLGNAPLGANCAMVGSGPVCDVVLTIAASASSATFNVALIDDNMDEANPTVIFTVQPDSDNYQVVSSTRNQHTLTITDDDNPVPVITFSNAISSSSEAGSSVNISIDSTEFVPLSGAALSVAYEVVGTSTATAGSDHSISASGGNIDISAGMNSGTLNVPLINDLLDEPSETLVLRLVAGTGYSVGTADTHTLTITDNDIPLVAFAESASTVAEDGGSAMVSAVSVILNPDYSAATPDDGTPFSGNDDQYVYITPLAAIVVPVRVTGGARSPADYTLSGLVTGSGGSTLTIPASDPPSASITITVINDTADESNETVVFTLSDPSGAPSLRVGGSIHTLTIEDDDMTLPTVSFEASKSVGENVGTANVQLMLSAPAPGLTLSYQVDTGNTTAAAPADYTALSGTVTVPVDNTATPGVDESTRATIEVTIVDDSDNESNERIGLVLRASAGNYIVGTPNRHTLTITDDDVPQVSFAAASSSLTEGNTTNAVVTVNVAPVPVAPLSVSLSFAGGATQGTDYSLNGVTGTGSVRQLSVSAASTTFTVSVVDDSDFEGNETVLVSFVAPGTGAGYTVASGTHTVTITDDDPRPADTQMVRFDTAASNVAEPGRGDTTTFNVRVRLDPAGTLAPTGGLAVRYQLLSSTATLGARGDYTIPGVTGTGTIQIVQGSNGADIPVVIQGDSTSEEAETINMRLLGPQTGTSYQVIADHRDHTVTIDTNGLVVSFASASSTAEEGAAATTFQVAVSLNINDPDGIGPRFRYSVAGDSTATVGDDYTLADPTDRNGLRVVNVTPGELTVNLAVTVLPDDTEEQDETIRLLLSPEDGLSPISFRLGSVREHVLTIPANDMAAVMPTLGFVSAGPIRATEEGAAALVRATISPPPTSDVTVTVGLNAGTTPAGDYTLNPAGRSLTFTASAPTATLTVTANDDADTTSESLTLSLPAPGIGDGYVLDPDRTNIRVVLRDNDSTLPQVQFRVASGGVRKADDVGGLVRMVFDRYPAGATAVPVRIRVAGGTATVGTDYRLSGATAVAATDPPEYTVNFVRDSNLQFSIDVLGAAGQGETIMLVLLPDDATPPRYTPGDTTTYTATIQADVVASFATERSTVVEGNAVTIPVAVTADGSRNSVSLALTYREISASSTSEAGDYTLEPSSGSAATVRITQGRGTVSLSFAAEEDTETPQADEVVVLELTASGSAYRLGETTRHIVYIVDDENATATPVASFHTAAGSFGEMDGSETGGPASRYRVRVGLSRPVTSSVSVNVGVSASSSATSGTDYTFQGISSAPFPVTIAGTSANPLSEAFFDINVPDDYVWERDETVVLELQAGTGYTLTGSTQVSHTLTIQEGEVIVLSVISAGSTAYDYFAQSHSHVLTHALTAAGATQDTSDDLHRWEVPESVGSLNFTVSSTAALVEDAEVHIEFYRQVNHLFSSGERVSARLGEDYTPPSRVVPFRAGQRSVSFSLEIVDDDLVEVKEVIHMQISTPGLNPKSGVLGIYGNSGDDCPGGGLTTAPNPDAGTRGQPPIIHVTAPPGTCALTDLLVPKAQQGTYAIEITDNDVPTASFTTSEGVDVFESAIPAGGSLSREVGIELTGLFTNAMGMAVLTESLELRLRIMATTGTVSVAASGTSDEVIVALLSSLEGDGHTLVRDTMSGPDWTLTVPAGASSTALSLSFYDDTDTEGREVLEVRLIQATMNPAYTVGTNPAHAIAIGDDDVSTVGFVGTTGTVTEPAAAGATGAATISFSSSIASAAAITVRYAVDGAASDAASGSDYQALSSPMQVIIPGGGTEATLTVTVLGDTAREGDERLVLTLPSSDDYTVDPASSTFTLIIDDQDAPSEHRIQFGMAQSSVTEGGTATIVVAADREARAELTIPIVFNAGSTSTAEPQDYTLPTLQAVIAQGSSSVNLVVPTMGDTLIEGNETLVFTIGDLGAVTAAVMGDPATHTLTIEDDDTTVIGFSTASGSVMENAGTHNVMLTASVAPAETLTIDSYSVVRGTALSPGDYTIPLSTTLSSGQTSAMIPIAIVDDIAPEGDETIVLSLADGPTGSSYTASGTTMHTLTIVANDLPQVQFRVASGGVRKADDVGGLVRMVFDRYSPSTTAVPVRIRVAGGTATVGTDYRLSGATAVAATDPPEYTVNFVRDSNLQFSIDVLGAAGHGETITLVLLPDDAAAQRYVLGATTTYTATIQADVVASFATERSTVVEGNAVTIPVAVTADGSRNSVSLALTYREISASSTSEAGDYTLMPSSGSAATVRITQGRGTVSLSFAAEEDTETPQADEVVVLELTASGSAYRLGETTRHTVYIVDDENATAMPVASFHAAAGSFGEMDASETGGPASRYRVRVGLSRPVTSSVSVNVDVGTSSSATSGTDYTFQGISSTPFPVTIAGTSANPLSEAFFDINVPDDYVWERDETVVLELQAGTGYTLTGSTQVSHTLTIQEGEVIVLSVISAGSTAYDYFAQSHSHVLTHALTAAGATQDTSDDLHRWEVPESVGSLSFTVRSTAALVEDAEVHIEFYREVNHLFSSGERVSARLGEDYTPPSRVIVPFRTGQSSVSFSLDIVDDMLAEAQEVIHMQISTPGLNPKSGVLGIYGNSGDGCPGGGLTGTLVGNPPRFVSTPAGTCVLTDLSAPKAQQGTYAIEITDNDVPTASFTTSEGLPVFEAPGTPETRSVVIELSGLPTNAMGTPALAASLTLQLRIVATTGTVSVAASADGTSEEVFVALPEALSNPPAMAGESAAARMRRAHVLTASRTLSNGWTLTVPAGANRTELTLTFNDDTVMEGSEVLEVQLVEDTDSYTRGTNSAHAITIGDND